MLSYLIVQAGLINLLNNFSDDCQACDILALIFVLHRLPELFKRQVSRTKIMLFKRSGIQEKEDRPLTHYKYISAMN